MWIRLGCAILFTAVLFSGAVGPGAAQSASPPVYNPANGHWYQAVQVAGNSINWPTARAAAESQFYAGYRGHLVTITSEDEQQFVSRNLPVSQQLYWWMGAYQDKNAQDYREPGGGWRWVTGEPWGSYTHWYPGQPDNDGNVHDQDGENVLEFDAKLGNLWNDFPVHLLIGGYLVEYEPPFPVGGSVAQFLLFPTSVVGGQSATGQVMLSGLAGPGGVVVPLSSGNPAAAVVPAVVTVPAGTTGVTFPVTTFPVPVPTPVVLSAGGAGGAVTATLQVQPNSSPTDNLLVNGSFEQPVVANGLDTTLGPGGLPGWNILRGTVNVNAYPLWQPAPGAGNQSLDLVGTPGAATIEQTFATTPGQEYVFSGWISHNADNPVAPEGRANVYLNKQFFIQLFHRDAQTTHNDMRWVQFAYRFQATAPTTTLTLEDVTNTWDAGGGIFLDGLAVTPTNAPVSPPPPAPTAPAAPSGLTAQALSSGLVQLQWQDNSNNETGFGIWRKEGSGDWVRIGVAVANQTSFRDGKVKPSTTYAYRLRAHNHVGASDWSNVAQVTTPVAPLTQGPPPAPAGLMAQAVSPVEVLVTWAAPIPGANGVGIWRKSGTSDWMKIAAPPAYGTKYRDRNVNPNTTYTYRARAHNNRGVSAWTNEVTVATPPLTQAPVEQYALSRPSDLAAQFAASGMVRLTWQDHSSNETGFGVWRQEGVGQWQRISDVPANAPHFTDRSARYNTRYTYRVRAHSKSASSAWSNEVAVTTPVGP